MTRSENLIRGLSSLDLTTLTDADSDEVIKRLCGRALTPHGKVAAVCLYPRFVELAAAELAGSGVRVATVVNFPAGSPDPLAAAAETAAVIAAGAEEVDVVAPWRAWLAGDHEIVSELISACRAVCDRDVRLKVIIESGCLGEAEEIVGLSRAAIAAGADFIKTSTGKMAVSATPEAARTIIGVIRDCGCPVGFKAAGGVSSVAQAFDYLAIADELMGSGWVSPGTFRFGASGLLDAILTELR